MDDKNNATSSSKFEAIQVFNFGSKLVQSLAFSSVPGTTAVFLVCGAVDNLVHVFSSSESTPLTTPEKTGVKFSKLTTLSGHESWVRALAFAQFENKSSGSPYLLLASAAQDRRVRLWKIEKTFAKPEAATRRLDPTALLRQLETNEEGQLEIEQHATIVTLPGGARWSIQLESVILGHDDWVLSAQWMPKVRSNDGKWVQMPRLLTASMDKTMVVWAPDEQSGLWIEATRVGEVGGNHLGFFGGLYGAYPFEGILALGYNGAFHLWRRVIDKNTPKHAHPEEKREVKVEKEKEKKDEENGDDDSDEESGNVEEEIVNDAFVMDIEEWSPQVSISGHFSDVKDVSWESSGAYFVSVSKDQTARIWSRWTHKPENIAKTIADSKLEVKNSTERYNWHEIARPQVHGHDLSNATFLLTPSPYSSSKDASSEETIRYGSHRFVSCAEEKVLRVFDAPVSFLISTRNLSGYSALSESDIKDRALSANVPALGLSNKPVFPSANSSPSLLASSLSPSVTSPDKNEAEKLYDEIHPNGGYAGFDMNDERDGHAPLVLSSVPPFEEQLLQRTLWPEIAKLYGHGNELTTVASSRHGDIIASACSCKVQTQEQAGIRVWDTSIWKETCQLNEGPSLTVTQMQFSHCDKYLAAVSRDRGVYLFERTKQSSETEKSILSRKMKVAFSLPNAHLRVIFSCSWTWDDKLLATGSRDKTVKIWNLTLPSSESESPQLVELLTLKFKSAVTAVAWVPASNRKDYVLAIGMENGQIQLSRLENAASKNMSALIDFHAQDTHMDSIKKMVWCQRSESEFNLATGSSDQSVRLFSVKLP